MPSYAAFTPESEGRRQISPSYPTVEEATAWRAGRGALHLDVLPITAAIDYQVITYGSGIRYVVLAVQTQTAGSEMVFGPATLAECDAEAERLRGAAA